MSSDPNEVLIMFLVPAASEAQALARSKVALQQVSNAVKRPAESFTEIHLFDNREAPGHLDKWGNIPLATSFDTDAGTELINEAISTTERSFRDNFRKLSEVLEAYTEDEFLTNEDMIRDRFLSLGAFVGPSIRVYTSGGQPLRCRSDLRKYEAEHDSLWVVPAMARCRRV